MRIVVRCSVFFALAWVVFVLTVEADAVRQAIAAVVPRVEGSTAHALYERAAGVSRFLNDAWLLVRNATETGGLGAARWAAIRESILPEVLVVERCEVVGNALWLVGLRCAALSETGLLIGALIAACFLDARVAARRRRARLETASPAISITAVRAGVVTALLGTAVLGLPFEGAETTATILWTAIAPCVHLTLARRLASEN